MNEILMYGGLASFGFFIGYLIYMQIRDDRNSKNTKPQEGNQK